MKALALTMLMTALALSAEANAGTRHFQNEGVNIDVDVDIDVDIDVEVKGAPRSSGDDPEFWGLERNGHQGPNRIEGPNRFHDGKLIHLGGRRDNGEKLPQQSNANYDIKIRGRKMWLISQGVGYIYDCNRDLTYCEERVPITHCGRHSYQIQNGRVLYRNTCGSTHTYRLVEW